MIEVLRGTNNDRIFQYGHQKLPVYGIGQDLNNNQWRSVFRQLVARGYMSVDLERFGALRLEEKCRPCCAGRNHCAAQRRSADRCEAQTKVQLAPEVDIALWEALRECRRGYAEELGVPPYVVFHDATLQEMCLRLPQTMEEFSQLSGVGERSWNATARRLWAL